MGVSVSSAASFLVGYAARCGLIGEGDRRWAYNAVLGACGLFGPGADGSGPLPAGFGFEDALAVMADAAVEAGRAEDSAAGRDRVATGVMGALMPRPSEVARTFMALCAAKGQGPEAATSWFYRLCCDANYVRASAIAKNLSWTHPSRWGDLQITINKSKPEKDPRDIAAAGAAQAQEAYPACQLCRENEGYSGRPAAVGGGHPARQNLRIVPVTLSGEEWGLQYSPYAYYEEHCIVMSTPHRPMHVDRANMARMLDFVDLFPHYFVGSNADLPIVGGSILSHDHFQGGRHSFPMARAQVTREVTLAGFEGVSCGVIKWPLTVLRLCSTDRGALLDACCHVMDAWRGWSDASAGIVARSGSTPHNTVTPICRRRGSAYEMDLALRCNVTTEEHPLGVFHPHEDKWHVKKENIGLIEVMGLAILPPRLEHEIEAGRLTREQIGSVFAAVLEDAGVFKWDEPGRDALGRFLSTL